MKSKAHILIVEDSAILYKGMKMMLTENLYSVSGFTPSFEEALAAIQNKMPDLALLDIQLQGTKTGIDLGKKLTEEYNIPFIYITDYGDDETFYKSLATNHEQFLVKTKPHLDTKELLRAVQTVLANKKNAATKTTDPKAIMCYTGFVNDLKQQGKDSLSEVPIPFQEITKITTKTPTNEKLKVNYVRIETNDRQSYYLPVSLSVISGKLPLQFIRINESEIVNLSENILVGRINGSRLQIAETVHHISKTYKTEVEKRINLLYGS